VQGGTGKQDCGCGLFVGLAILVILVVFAIDLILVSNGLRVGLCL
jgi:hypothetical protein